MFQRREPELDETSQHRYAAALTSLGNQYRALGRLDEACRAHEEAVRLRRLLAAHRPDAYEAELAVGLANLCLVLTTLERHEEASTAPLVERGAPRDFRDVHAVCRAGLASAGECWRWWRRRQELAGSDADGHRARLAVETHLERIARHRPLEEIEDPDRRVEAESVRRWFREEFLHAALD